MTCAGMAARFRWAHGVVFISSGLTLLGACGGLPDPDVAIDRHEVVIDIQPDGVLLVSERLQGPLFSGHATFHRTVQSDRSDRVEFNRASLDDRVLVPGANGDVHLDVDGTNRLDVRWTTRGIDAGRHVAVLDYRVIGAIGYLNERGALAWPVLPSPRRMSVGESRIELKLPDTASILRGSGMAETGWAIEVLPHGMVATRRGVGLEPVTLLAEFPVNTGLIAVPEWQLNHDRQGEFAPAFVSGAIFMVVIGVGVIWIVWFQHPRLRADGQPPASASVEALSERETRAVRKGVAPGARSLARGLIARGLMDPERHAAARGLVVSAWIGTAVAAICAVVAHLVLWRFGWWAQLIPATMPVVAIWFIVFARWFRVLTPEGERVRAALRRSGRH
jgi:hypothetical protein